MPRLSHLVARRFRNLEAVELAPAPGLTLLVGANGQGKTNVLEAIFYLFTAHSWRTAQLRELIQWEQPALHVSGTLTADGGGATRVERGLDRSGRRSGPPGMVAPVVFFGPDDLRLVKGAPADRRRFLDTALAMLDGRYLRSLRAYHHVLLQRNRALREGGSGMAQTLEEFGQLLAEHGCYLWRARLRFVDRLRPLAAMAATAVAAEQPLEVALAAGGHAEPLTEVDAFVAALRRRRREELARAVTLVGPHRDDLLLRIGGQDATRFGSQGQQRTVAIALRLGQYRLMTDLTGQAPLLLFDDMLSELDPVRRQTLLEFVAQAPGQAVLADTQAERYRGLPVKVYRLQAGQLNEVG